MSWKMGGMRNLWRPPRSNITKSMYPKENACVSHLLRTDGVQNSPTNFDINPVTLTFDLNPCDLNPGPSFLKLGWKLEFLHFWPWWPWPSNLSEIWWSLMCAPIFRSVGPTVQFAECKQTHTQTDAIENITSSTNREVIKVAPGALDRSTHWWQIHADRRTVPSRGDGSKFVKVRRIFRRPPHNH